MKIIPALLLAIVLLVPSIAFAQHSVALSAQPSTTVGVASYNVYRAPCTAVASGVCSAGEGTFAKIGTATIGTTLTYTDATVKGGFDYSYYMTAVCTTGCGTDANGNQISGESAPSNKIGVVIPPTPPQPPANLTVTNVTRNSTGANTTLSAHWTDAPNVSTTYTFFANGSILATGTQVNATGAYAAVWSGKVKPGSAVTFEVCDTTGICQSKLI